MTERVWEDQWLDIWSGDCRDVLGQLPEKSVHAVITSPPYFGLRSYLDDDNPDKDKEIGREPSPTEYVEAMVEVLQAVRRVLRDDGTVWLNIGDSYAAQRGGTSMPAETISGGVGGYGPEGAHRGRGDGYQPHRNASAIGLKHKDLIGIPWRVAFALQADGWILRNDIIWSTPNPMPESVRDRFTVSHEYVFLLAKSPRYFFDQDAVREPHTDVTLNRVKYGLNHRHPGDKGVGIPPVKTTTVEGAGDFGTATVTTSAMGDRFANPLGRNRRTVWTIPTKSYKGAHYAVFPESLVEPMILAATSAKGVCPECGAPWARVTEKVREARGDAFGRKDVGDHDHGQAGSDYEALVEVKTVGWAPTCAHEMADPVPATVLDPFAGSGTVGLVAQTHSRRAILIDLNGEYLTQQLARNAQVPLGLASEG